MENEEDFDQKRFLVAMILSGLIIVLWQAFFAPPPAPPVDQVAGQTNAAQTGGQVVETDGQPVQAQPQTPPPTDIKAPVDLPVKRVEMKTSDFRVAFSTRGARLVEAEVLQPEQYNVEGDLLGGIPEDSFHFPFGLDFTRKSIALHRELVWELAADKSVARDGAYEAVVFRHTDPGGRFVIEKSFTATTAPYQLDMEVSITNRSESVIADKLALDITGWKDPNEESSFLDMLPNDVEGVCATTDDIERELYSSIDGPLVFDEGKIKWGGVDNRYFLFAAIPRTEGEKCTMEILDDLYLRTRMIQPEFSIAAGQTHSTKYRVFVGPKDYEVLEEMGSGIEQSVDFGIFTFLARPFRWLLVQFYDFVGNWGLAIILLTFLIRLILWPVNQKVYVNSEKMKELQPALNAIKEKYADDQQRLGEETMKVWKEHGVSPLGCLPMFLQFPILLALYFMILNSVELYQADFILWYTDLSASDPYFVLPILMGIVMFAQQSMMTVETPNPQMATMMKVMPVMFTAFMLFLPSGVVLYYFVSLIIGLLQQFWIRRSYAAKKAQAA